MDITFFVVLSCLIAVNTFLLLATNESINYLPIPVDGSNATAKPRQLSIGLVNNIRAIAYDPANKSVLWVDNTTSTLQSVTISGSERWEFPVPAGLNTISMAYDWFGGQLFVTESSGFQIELLTLNGESVGSLLKFTDNPLSLNKPGEVVFDDVNRLVSFCAFCVGWYCCVVYECIITSTCIYLPPRSVHTHTHTKRS